jgi:hypothetical protein
MWLSSRPGVSRVEAFTGDLNQTNSVKAKEQAEANPPKKNKLKRVP